MRIIDASVVKNTVKKLFLDCNYYIGEDVMRALETAKEEEISPVGKNVLEQIIENDTIAANEQISFCNDSYRA